MNQVQNDHDLTQERILDEAERLFAEKGFAAVSVREITSAAHCHLAAVNYHFGGKQALYLDVFRRRWVPRAQKVGDRLRDMAERQSPTAEEVVRGITGIFFSAFSSEQESQRHAMLMMRELAQPGEALELVFNDAIRPNFRIMIDLLKPHLPPQIENKQILLYLFSIFAQLIYFNMARMPVMRATGRDYDESFVAELVDHITDFSLHGLPFRSKQES